MPLSFLQPRSKEVTSSTRSRSIAFYTLLVLFNLVLSTFASWVVLIYGCQLSWINEWSLSNDLCPLVARSDAFPEVSGKLEKLVRSIVEDQFSTSLASHNRQNTSSMDLDLSQRGLNAKILGRLSSMTATKDVPPTGGFFSFSRRSPSPLPSASLPAVVLESHLILGDCWEFRGAHGHLAIHLPYRAHLTAFSVHYFPAHELSPHARLQVPRRLTLWGLVKSPGANQEPLGSQQRPASHFLRRGGHVPETINPGDVFIPLSEAVYDAHSTEMKQSFSIPKTASRSYLFDVVVVEVTDNWGGNSTCLYHVGVHGQILEPGPGQPL